MKTYWGGGIASRILDLGTRRIDQLYATAALIPRENPGTDWIGG